MILSRWFPIGAPVLAIPLLELWLTGTYCQNHLVNSERRWLLSQPYCCPSGLSGCMDLDCFFVSICTAWCVLCLQNEWAGQPAVLWRPSKRLPPSCFSFGHGDI